MKRFWILVALAMISGLALSAQMGLRGDRGAMPMMGGPLGEKSAHFKLLGAYQEAELAALKSELGNRTLGELTGAELLAWSDRMSIAERKDAWVASSARASFMFPGMGQLKNKDGVNGSLFAAAHIVTLGGSLAAAYWLLPADLKFDQLNYYSSSYTVIKNRWEGKSFEDYLPAMGAIAGGMVVDMVWRVWSGHSALLTAKSRIDDGIMTFEPTGLPGGLGFMLRY
jgi:hypothetical protein